MRLLARVSILILLVGAGTSLLALQRGGYQQQQDNPYGVAQVVEASMSRENRLATGRTLALFRCTQMILWPRPHR